MSDDTLDNKSGFDAVDKYDWAEYDYPGYAEMIDLTASAALAHNTLPDIVEIGPGAGALTEKLAFGRVHSVKAIEITEQCAKHLKQKIRENKLPHTTVIHDDFLKWAGVAENQHLNDSVVSSFTSHHFPPSLIKKRIEAELLTLTEQGNVIIGDALLRTHDETNPKERINAHMDLHAGVIDKCLKEGKLQFPILELEALASGLATTTQYINALYPEATLDSCEKEEVHPANKEAIKTFMAMKRKALKVSETQGESHSDAEAPETSASQMREEYITKLSGLIDALQTSEIAGIDPDYFEQHPEICSIGACDYKYTLNEVTQWYEDMGMAAEAKQVMAHAAKESAFTSVSDEMRQSSEGGLMALRFSRKSDEAFTSR